MFVQLVRIASVIFSVIAFGGCTTVDRVELSTQQMQEQISAGKVIKPGDIVTIVTSDIRYEDVQVAAVSKKSVSCSKGVFRYKDTIDEKASERKPEAERETFEIPIADIVAVEKKEATTVGKVAFGTGAVVGISAFYYFVYFILPAAIGMALLGS